MSWNWQRSTCRPLPRAPSHHLCMHALWHSPAPLLVLQPPCPSREPCQPSLGTQLCPCLSIRTLNCLDGHPDERMSLHACCCPRGHSSACLLSSMTPPMLRVRLCTSETLKKELQHLSVMAARRPPPSPQNIVPWTFVHSSEDQDEVPCKRDL